MRPAFCGKLSARISSSAQSKIRFRSRSGCTNSSHELHLVEAGFKEEACERRQSFLAEIASAVKIIAARKITLGQVALI